MLILQKNPKSSSKDLHYSSIDMRKHKKKPILAEALPYDGSYSKDVVDILTMLFIIIPGVVFALYILYQSDENNMIAETVTLESNNNNHCYDIKMLQEMYRSKMEDIEKLIEKRVQMALAVYDADKTGMIDYALESAGGMIVSTPETVTYPLKRTYQFFSMMSIGFEPTANIILQARTHPGDCYAFTGCTGRFRIKLFRAIEVTAVTIEHAAFSISSDLRSAPREFIIYGLDSSEVSNGDELGRFEYNIQAPSALQTFKMVAPSLRNAYNYLELQILSNYGHPMYTCLYRVRVHGKP